MNSNLHTRNERSAENRPLFKIILFFLQHGQVQIQPFVDISGEQLLHDRQVMLHMVRIKGAVVGQAVRELDVDGREPGLHQFQIDQQTPGAAIAVDEGVDALKLDMEPGQPGDDVLGALCVARHELSTSFAYRQSFLKLFS